MSAKGTTRTIFLRSQSAAARAAVLAVAAMSLPAQPPVPDAALTQKRLAYYEAYRVWRQADPYLEHDLGAAPADDLHRRIADARAKAVQYTNAREDYYRQTLSGFTSIIGALGNPADPVGMDDVVNTIETQQAALATQISELSKTLTALGADNRKSLQRQAAERQSAALIGIQTNLAEQLLQIQESAKSGAAAGGLRSAMLESYRTASALLGQEIAITRQETTLWDAYYASLDTAVTRRGPPRPAIHWN
ncbi:MAG: hypothetical protein ABI165_02890 [Bryobacteraceae bacterium]